MMRSSDYVVVGGGTAGAVVARRLADAGAEVWLLEAGPTGENDDRVLRLTRWAELVETELDWDFTIEEQERGNKLIRHSRARVLGGCSSHNTCIAFRAPDWDLAEWERLGATGWGVAGTSEYFRRVFDRVNIEQADQDNECAQAFVGAGVEFGLPLVDYGTPNVHQGVGWFKLNKRSSIRQSSAVAYLFPTSQLPRTLRLGTEEEALRIRFNRERATGVETTKGFVAARKEVIVCGGAIGSPKLLLLSGIGPENDLRKLGIPLVVHRTGVGQHFIDHPEGIVLWEARRPMPGISSHWETGLFTTVDGESPFPDLMAHFTTQRFDLNTVARGYPTAEHAFSLNPNVTRPRSEGFLRLLSAVPDDPPLLNPRYYTDPDGYDERLIVAGIELARELARQPSLRPWIKRELAPGAEMRNRRELATYARLTGNTNYHPAGTCKIGAPGDSEAVVDPSLRVIDVENVRVADASVFPCMTTVNPCITCMMIGEKCSDLILTPAEGSATSQATRPASLDA